MAFLEHGYFLARKFLVLGSASLASFQKSHPLSVVFLVDNPVDNSLDLSFLGSIIDNAYGEEAKYRKYGSTEPFQFQKHGIHLTKSAYLYEISQY
jgi:hypothetical protein